MKDEQKSRNELLVEIQNLRERLATSEETLRAIQEGEVDALVVSTPQGEKIFTLQSADLSYRLLVEQMPQGAATISTEGTILYCNKSFAKLLQKSLEKLIGSEFDLLIAPQDQTLFQSLINQAAKDGEKSVELLLINSNNVQIPVYLSINYLKLDKSTVYCVVITDLTAQKDYEKTQAAERLARLILEQAGETIIVCDRQGKIIRVSQTAYDLWGENLLLQTFNSRCHLYSKFYAPINQDESTITGDLEKLPFSIDLVLAGSSYQALEVEVERPDGQFSNLVLNARPLTAEENELKGAVIILTDITKIKQAELALQQLNAELESRVSQRTIELQQELLQREEIEQQLRQSEGRFHAFMNHNPACAWITDTNGKIVYINQTYPRTFKLFNQEVIGRNIFELYPSEIAQQFLNNIQEVASSQKTLETTELAPRTDGTTGEFLVYKFLIPEPSGHQLVGGIALDITERYKVERMKAEFISVVSHELRTPLTSMQAALSLLSEKIIDPNSAEGEATIQIATEGTDRLVRLVNDILDLERLEYGKIRLEKSLCNVGDLIETAIAQMLKMASQADITIKANPCDFQIQADGDRLLQVLINLLSNAIKFSPHHSTIELLVKQQQSQETEPFLLFTVCDQGRGIPADKLDSLFTRFHQVDASDSRTQGGTGLGLAICQSIIQQHGGNIWVESSVGKGSTFYFTLPIE
jgi:PAS domain S-box-containing protein